MTVSSLNSLSQSATGATQKSATNMSQTYDQFLKLLTTQLKNQDPLSPMDTNQMTSQIVQFSQVEQQIAINDKLDKMVQQSKISATLNAAGFIDKVVEAAGDYVILDRFSGKFTVGLDGDASKSTVAIKNANGDTVRSLSFNGKKGRNELVWDGKNESGILQPDGVYSINVTPRGTDGKAAKTADGKEVKVTGDTGDYVTLDRKENKFSGRFVVGLDDDAPKSAVVIQNEEGEVVRNLSFNGKKGRNELVWDGKNDFGALQPGGAYSVKIIPLGPDGKAAHTADGKEVKAAVATIGRVTDVVVDDKGVTKLSLRGAHVDLDSLLQVKKAL